MTERYAASKTLFWIYPQDERPPVATKIALLTRGNVQVTGVWSDDGSYVAWQRLFKRDKTKEQNEC